MEKSQFQIILEGLLDEAIRYASLAVKQLRLDLKTTIANEKYIYESEDFTKVLIKTTRPNGDAIKGADIINSLLKSDSRANWKIVTKGQGIDGYGTSIKGNVEGVTLKLTVLPKDKESASAGAMLIMVEKV